MSHPYPEITTLFKCSLRVGLESAATQTRVYALAARTSLYDVGPEASSQPFAVATVESTPHQRQLSRRQTCIKLTSCATSVLVRYGVTQPSHFSVGLCDMQKYSASYLARIARRSTDHCFMNAAALKRRDPHLRVRRLCRHVRVKSKSRDIFSRLRQCPTRLL